jgi:hypothetical protein
LQALITGMVNIEHLPDFDQANSALHNLLKNGE